MRCLRFPFFILQTMLRISFHEIILEDKKTNLMIETYSDITVVILWGYSPWNAHCRRLTWAMRRINRCTKHASASSSILESIFEREKDESKIVQEVYFTIKFRFSRPSLSAFPAKPFQAFCSGIGQINQKNTQMRKSLCFHLQSSFNNWQGFFYNLRFVQNSYLDVLLMFGKSIINFFPNNQTRRFSACSVAPALSCDVTV